MTERRSFGDDIRDARNARGWTQETLAEKASVSRPTIARVERGDDVSTANLAKVAGALGLQITLSDRTTSRGEGNTP
ncbi:helix-turn-helix transcriptional regulator [Microbacterium sp. ARD32]|uniref:helix-turn-helix domain-containing protein n=1 Tax=Microbacterium sp. ARD32 TaxID=2962577 RepID=UPI002881562E|nr:helix-turn-helix transcriptional regulator [Microbacterium sp. ARD32]MDT0157241.1 helix-turn-helix transcriptional regulator [Microbacterium sp. ARD32]